MYALTAPDLLDVVGSYYEDEVSEARLLMGLSMSTKLVSTRELIAGIWSKNGPAAQADPRSPEAIAANRAAEGAFRA